MIMFKKGTAAFRRVNLALFIGGFVTFANLYVVQPLMPAFSDEFNTTPAVASLTLSVTTIFLAIAMLFTGSLSESWGRKGMMEASVIAVSVLAIVLAFAPGFHSMLVLRILQGIVFAGLPSIAMAYLGEEIEPSSLGIAMGIYISGNTIGGLSGRVITGTVADFFDWRTALIVMGIISLIASLIFYWALPKSKHFQPRRLQIKQLIKSMGSHLRNPALLCLYGMGFLLMGSFVTMYNYVEFQLVAPPFSLSQTLVGWIFIIYLVGTVSSTWFGNLAMKHGRRSMLMLGLFIMFVGALITLDTNLFIKIFGMAAFTFGFFASHSIASGWVGYLAGHDKAQAASLYLFFYYFGSSVGGTAGGIFWTDFGWEGVIAMIAGFILLSFILLVFLSRTVTLAKQEGTLVSR
ncbi:MFS transporter [Virgibacillus halophilus]|uniref:MFS transporter n=1 Tax=Tigheibacillus halophilus TaxID=361280 RepID=A0ABU5C5I7_9BACI|nr:MFS transporter [Virgibacillus halophilus]